MYIQQVELTRGVGKDFVKALTALSVKEEHGQGAILFRKGEPANHAYLLLIGRVHLKMGETGQVVHIVSRPGETFGWSSLVNRDVFSSTAECVEQTNLRKLHREDLRKLLAKDPVNGLIFFQRLAGMLGDRLLESYARYEKLFSGETFV
ncbi:MAG: cyclic nucleotide-binding domain-containing protein [Desulfobacterales bacterium]|jgi:CRP-like cAMP-binding protein|nr:cyclic nucleotide-binding domain-containing protein [Desulfobacterales bacterium]